MKITLNDFLETIFGQTKIYAIYIEFKDEFKNGFIRNRGEFFEGGIMHEKNVKYTFNQVKERFGNFEVMFFEAIAKNLITISIYGEEAYENSK